MKVLIATPMYNSQCTSGYTASMIQLFKKYGNNKDIELDFMYGTNEALVTYARNMIANLFLKSDFTHLLFIDADMQFDPDQVFKMIQTKRDFVCGVYPKKKIDWSAVKNAAMMGAKTEELPSYANEYLFEPVPNVQNEEDGTIEILRSGTGMMMISRKVFEELKDKVDKFNLVSPVMSNIKYDQNESYYEFFYTSKDPEKNIFMNEDFTFCNLWRENGGKIYGAPWVKLFHIGNHVYG
jgi:hypothetical protein